MKLNDIIKKKADLIKEGYKIENEMIKWVDVKVYGHFGNTVSLEIFGQNSYLFGTCMCTGNIGMLIQAFVELFDLTEEDGVRISNIKNLPCRVVLDSHCTGVVGFGHFMKDRFVMAHEFAGIDDK